MPDCYVPWTVQLAGSEPTAREFTGLAAVYGQPDDGRDYGFARGAFDAAVQQARAGRFPPMLLQHGGWDMDAEDMLPIGIWTEMSADAEGLKVRGTLADTTRGRDVLALLRMDPRPAIDGLSIGFRPTKRTVNENAKPGEPRVTIQEIELVEISVVTFPAMERARIARQSAGSDRDLERRLVRDAGLSRREARALLRAGKPGLDALRDAGEGGDDGDEAALLAEIARRIERNTQAMRS